MTDIDAYLLTIIPFVTYLTIWIFYLIWAYHYNSCISEEESDHSFVKPEKYCMEIEGFEEDEMVQEKELKQIFQQFGPIYEVSLVLEHKNQLKYFEELDELEEKIRTGELESTLGAENQK